MSKTKNYLLWTVYLLALTLIGARLFFEEQTNSLASLLLNQTTRHGSNETLTIGYAYEPASLDPLLFDASTRSRLVDMYEGLVKTDRNLKIRPALARSWGLLDPLTWEFKLRHNVTFHNGKKLEMDDVVTSIQHAKKHQKSQLAGLLNTINELQIIDQETIHIKTSSPDPLLLNKLAVVYISPKDHKNIENPIGTGPYQLGEKRQNELELKAFLKYWGEQPSWQNVLLQSIPNKNERLQKIESGTIDLLADVPPASAKSLNTKNLTVRSIPSLEVNFVLFNLQNSFFKNKEMRKALRSAFDSNEFVKIGNEYANPVSQFVSNGVFGFNPSLPLPKYDLEKAQKTIEKETSSIFERLTVTLDYPKGLDTAAEYLQSQLEELGIELKLNPLDAESFQKKLTTGQSQLVYVGWKSELGDSGDFLNAVVHTKDPKNQFGEFNVMHYSNPEVDQLIKKTAQDLNAKSRLQNLQKIMKTIVEDDVIGIPLFETETIFAFNKKIPFEPRVDGFIHAAEIQ